jgi:hypothetical protein
MAAVLAVWTALYHSGALVLLLSPSLRQSAELFKRCLGIYRAVSRPIGAESESALYLTLDNRSRIVSLPGKDATVRGFSGVDLLVIDEAARVPDELYLAVRPMLAVSSGRLIALSTPFGRRGWWYEAWRAEETWERYEVPASACPRIPPTFLEEERRTLGAWWYGQEYCCEFVEALGSVFSTVSIEGAFTSEVTPLWPDSERPWP